MSYTNKTSLLVPSELPEFIRDDTSYATFVTFMQAYYEWTELQNTSNSQITTANSTNQGVTYASKNLVNYYDIDNTINDFLDYYRNDFLTFFPPGALVDERTLVKFAKELYKTKGTPASYEFLFRILYNSDVQLFNSKDYILKPSDGKWVITNYINLATSDPTWSQSVGYKLFGLTTKGFATIEAVQNNGTYTTLYLSDILNNFASDEDVAVTDVLNNVLLFNGNPLEATTLGILQGVSINPSSLGINYQIGDPVVFYGGLDTNLPSSNSANAFVSAISEAAITGIYPTFDGYGYRIGNTNISVNSTTGGTGASAILTAIDNNPFVITYLNLDTISSFCNTYANSTGSSANVPISNSFYVFANTIASVANVLTINANTSIANSLYFSNLTTYGVSSIAVLSGGVNYQQGSTTANATATYTNIDGLTSFLPSMGLLAPINIVNPGVNYANGDTIVFTGGGGFGAYAYVNVAPYTGTIVSVTYTTDPAGKVIAPLGGMGYNSPPTLSVSSTQPSHNGAVLTTSIVGYDAILAANSGLSGQVLQVTLGSAGQGYVNPPGVSLRVDDILIYNSDPNNTIKQGDKVIQTDNGQPSGNTLFLANVDSIQLYGTTSGNSFNSNYNLRIYDYVGTINVQSSLIILRNGQLIGGNLLINTANTTDGFYILGQHLYGNGLAKPIANFSEGVLSDLTNGFYLNADGQPSTYSVIQSQEYNNYSYFLKVEKALETYKNTALKFLHPAGLNYVPINMVKNSTGDSTAVNFTEELSNNPLINVITPFTANLTAVNANTIKFTNIVSSAYNVANVILANSFITVYPANGSPFYSQVISVANTSDSSGINYTVRTGDRWINSVGNVTTGFASDGTSSINISNLTQNWKIATGNTNAYFSNIAFGGDQITFTTANTNLGVLQPISIINGGTGYFVGNTISIVGGGGIGAFANITSVSGSGAITSINYVKDPSGNTVAPLGGFQYTSLPTVTVTGLYGSGAQLAVPGFVYYKASNTATINKVIGSNVFLNNITFTSNVLQLGTNTWLTTNGSITLTRNVVTSNVYYSGPIAPVVLVELTTEDYNSLTTEDSRILLIG